MPLKKSSDVPLVSLEDPVNQKRLFELIAKVLQPDIPDLTPASVEKLVTEREREGETYIGYGTAILHLISEKIAQTMVLLVKTESPLNWHSDYSGEVHQIDKFVVLAISPHDQNGERFRPVMQKLADEDSINQLFEME
ncbi:PTS sugar transporter subunit IIA [Lacticaseibacillus styriensis]|uniref:PTS sugar IIA subunit n=2 Tax=Lacticaseibacillus TaxID=2759736 RepID=A0AAN1F0R3_LACCA|nr:MULTISPECIES: PTS sugar transporter subunit IIA [Lacticaseibacillus]ARY92690.1 PTS sugar IIA subunit [Lacticaseibacillus casei]WLV80591.1 PTS sugar transporter subunit IIA [Lacticaseibacillus sp. NCIMB 15473]WNX27323.1 PTS sugar transporter subunit IIA [Lacticaseibacillus casei]